MHHLEQTEPAVLRGVVTAVLALAVSLGFVIPADLSTMTELLIPIAAVLIPLAQSLWTRAAVWSPRSVAEAVGKHAAPESR
jgi:hypothetical protein